MIKLFRLAFIKVDNRRPYWFSQLLLPTNAFERQKFRAWRNRSWIYSDGLTSW